MASSFPLSIHKNTKWLLAAGAVLAILISCTDFPEVPYSERLIVEISSSEGLTSSSSDASSSSSVSSSSDASSSSSVSSSSDVISSSSETENSFTDERNHVTYTYIEIDGQAWMAQNLNYAASTSTCYDNQTVNCSKYGRLYSLEAAKTACPSNWHLPSSTEWNALLAKAGGSLVADFAVLRGGYGNGTYFFLEGIAGSWWSSDGYYYIITDNYDDVQSEIDLPDALNSVRCVRGNQ